MHSNDIQDLERLENSHWWHVSKREVIVACVKKYASSKTSVLEIGAGSGTLLAALKKFGRLTALDSSSTATAACRKKGIENVVESSFEAYQPTQKFSIIVAADIIEHIEDDTAAIHKIYNLTEPRGMCIVHVPAHQFLFSYWDKRMGHFRRYEISDLQQKFLTAGFKIELLAYRLSIFVPFVLLFRLLKRDKSGSSDFEAFPILNGIFLALTQIESLLILKLGLRFPFGLSILLVARK